MTNNFYLLIKLLAVDPANGKAFVPPCEIKSVITVDLNDYIQEFARSEDFNSAAYQSAIENSLKAVQAGFNVPLGWLIVMESTDEFFALDNPFYKPQVRRSEEFFYSPAHDRTKVETEFLWEWAVDTVTNKQYAPGIDL